MPFALPRSRTATLLLLTSTIEFVKGDKRFRNVEWDVQLDPELPQIRADVGQIQGVFINLFVNAAAVEQQTGTRNMDKLGGISDKMPVTGTTSVIAFLSTAGIPPLSGFWSKLIIIIAAVVVLFGVTYLPWTTSVIWRMVN